MTKSPLSIEKNELILLGICSLAILTAWIIICGGWPSALLMNNDAIFFLPKLARYFPTHSWENYLYRSDFLGGAVFSDVFGKPPVYDLLSFAGLEAHTIMNLSLIFSQILFGYFGIKSSVNLARTWGYADVTNVITLFGMALLFGFLPVLGSRVQYGHSDLIWGLLLFFVLTSAALAIKTKDISIVYSTIMVLGLWHIIVTCGHQTKLYSVIFGAPILIGLLWTSQAKGFLNWVKENKTSILIIAGVIFAGLCIALPRFIGMLEYATGTDSMRSVGGESIVYKYPGTQFLNYLSSIFWNYKLAARTTDIMTISEFYFPMGPLFLFLLLLPKNARWGVAIGLGVSLIFSVCLSLKIWPINQLMIDYVPTLKSFRCPERSILPFCAAIALFGSALILLKTPAKFKVSAIPSMLVAAILIGVFSAWPEEILLWGISFCAVVLVLRKKVSLHLSAPALALILGMGSVSAFNVWRVQVKDKSKTQSLYEQLAQNIKQQVPELKSPLTRTFLDYSDQEFSMSTPAAFDLSVVEGYSMPLRRFAGLYGGLEQINVESTSTVFRLSKVNRSANVMRALYNICCEVGVENDKSFKVQRIGPTLGPVWTSADVFLPADIKSVAADLLNHESSITEYLKSKILFDFSDPVVKMYFTENKSLNFNSCTSTQPQLESTSENKQEFIVKFTPAGLCPLTFATNYTSRFHAYEMRERVAQNKLAVLPSYGALTTVMVPPGVTEILLRIEPHSPLWARLCGLVGWALIIFLIWFIWVKYLKTETAPIAKESFNWQKKGKRNLK